MLFRSVSQSRYGLLEFLNLGGSYVDTFLNGGLYRYAVVHSARITLKAVNVGSEPMILACAPLPYSWATGSPTLSEILDQPSCVRATVGSSSGIDKGLVVNSASAKRVLGKDYQLAKDRKSTRLNSSHSGESRMPSSASGRTFIVRSLVRHEKRQEFLS